MGKNNSKTIIVVILAAFFGLAGGIAGGIIGRVYFFEKSFNIPLVGGINLLENYGANQGLVIREAKNVIVEQNTKVRETINSSSDSIVGIFIKKNEDADQAKDGSFDYRKMVASAYDLNSAIGQGLIITSDGWIISSFFPETIKTAIATATKESILDDYVIITKNRQIYEIENIIIDPAINYSFWRVRAKDLPVKVFSNPGEISNGQLIVMVGWNGRSYVTTVKERDKSVWDFVKNSDNRLVKITPAGEFDPRLKGSFVFNLNGELAAMINGEGIVESISNFMPCINCLLSGKAIEYPNFGVNYVNLSEMASNDKNFISKGAMLYPDKNGIAVKKGSAAEMAGLKAGDIIISINNIEINRDNDLQRIINQYSAKQEVTLKYFREDREFTQKVIL